MRICEVDGCDRKHSCKGYCAIHYARIRRTGSTEATERIHGELLHRLRVKTMVVGECWLSTRAFTRRPRGDDGYPGIRVGDRMLPVHQAGWMALRGPIPEGKELHHECSNKRCWNPDHLTPLTKAEHGAVHAKEVCTKGHPMTPDNLYVRPNPPKGWSGRECRACREEYARASNRRRAERRIRERT